jgi:hypothetical protein
MFSSVIALVDYKAFNVSSILGDGKGRTRRAWEGGFRNIGDWRVSTHELEIGYARDEAALVGQGEETADAFAAAIAVVEGPVVNVHADELVGEITAHVAGVLEGVLDGFGAVVEAVLDAAGEDVGNLFSFGGFEAFVDDVAAEGQGKAILGLVPPDSEILAEFEALITVSELSLVNNEADVGLARADGLEDLVEGDHEIVDLARGFFQPKLEREEGAGHGAGDGDFFAGDFFPGVAPRGDQHGAVAVPHAGAAGKERVLATDVGVGVNADGRDIKFSARGALVERLNILEDVIEFEFAAGD